MKLFEYLVFVVLLPAISANSLRGEAQQEPPRQLAPAADTYIFQTQADGFATGQGDKVGTDCSTDTRRVFFVDGGDDGDYIDIITSKWVRK